MRATEKCNQTEDSKISVAYHFFPHYRGGVIKELQATLDPIFVADTVGIEGINVFKFPSNRRFVYAPCTRLGPFTFQIKVVSHCLFTSDEYIVFLADPNNLSVWLGGLICRARRKRVIFWGHGFITCHRDAKNYIRKAFFSIAHAFFTYGWRAKRNAIKMGFDQDNIYVGYNSLDYAYQLSIRNSLLSKTDQNSNDPKKDSLSILCISRLTQRCRYDLLFKAVDFASRQGLKFAITIIGDGPERNALEDMSTQLNLDVTYVGAIYDEKVIAQFIFNADVTVSPGKVGLTAMHSLMYGTPVITHGDFEKQMPEVESIIPGFTGEFFNEGSATALSETLIDFKNRYTDRTATRSHCFRMIDDFYNPGKQVKALKNAIYGLQPGEGSEHLTLFKEKLNEGT